MWLLRIEHLILLSNCHPHVMHLIVRKFSLYFANTEIPSCLNIIRLIAEHYRVVRSFMVQTSCWFTVEFTLLAHRYSRC